MTSFLLAVILGAASLQEETLRFSAEDVATLREIQRVKDLGRSTAALLLTSPVMSMLTSSSAASFVVTVVSTEYNRIGEAASDMATVTACQIRNIVAYRLIDTPTPSPAVRRYFNRLHDAADAACDGTARREPQSEPPSAGSPGVTPLTVKPQLRNPTAVTAALQREYPELLRQAGVGGTVVVWIFIDETGRVVRTRISRGSEFTQFNDAALKVAALMQFTPGEGRDGPIGTWIEVPINFNVR